MNYTILPKKNHIPTLFFFNTQEQDKNQNVKMVEPHVEPHVSHSIQHYYNDVVSQFNQMKKNECVNKEYFEEIEKIMNHYEFLFSKVSGSKFSVSKLRPSNPVFYVYMELMYSNGIMDSLKNKNINSIFFSSSGDVFIECMNILREEYKDNYISTDSISYKENTLRFSNSSSVDLLYIELKEEKDDLEKNYILNSLYALCNTILYQKYQGVTLLKLDVLIHKPILEIIYLYTCLFEKVTIVKPVSCNIMTNERFLVCKNYRLDTPPYDFFNKLNSYLKMNTIEYSLLNFELPYFFLNKIEESNVSIGFQQIEQIDLIMNIIKNKNREEKLENIKKTNIQKCILWCEKYKIPHNKFLERGNIFLPENQKKREENELFRENTMENTASEIARDEEIEENEETEENEEREENEDTEDLEEENIEDFFLLHTESRIELECYANRILEEQINMGIDEYLYEPSLYI